MTSCMSYFSVIVACCKNGGIGINNTIPWNIKEDMKHFRELTTSCPEGKINAIIMGRKTWESLPKHPLPKRLNIVVSTTYTNQSPICQGNDMVVCVSSLDEALHVAYHRSNINHCWVIGGSRLYEEALCHSHCHSVHVTYVLQEVQCDTFFPLEDLNQLFQVTWQSKDTITENGMSCTFTNYRRNGVE